MALTNSWKVNAHIHREGQRKEAVGDCSNHLSVNGWAVRHRSISIRLSCRTFSISETCYRYQPKLSDENERIADHLLALTNAKKMWGFGLCYRQRWIVEQFFRILKQQGLRLEDSQLASADRLLILTAVAAAAACTTLQLVQARNGQSGEHCNVAFTSSEIRTLEKLQPQLEGSTAAQKNPYSLRSLAWASWVIAKLGGWDGIGLQDHPAQSHSETASSSSTQSLAVMP